MQYLFYIILITLTFFYQSKITQCYYHPNNDDDVFYDRQFFDKSPENIFKDLDGVFDGVTHLQSSLPRQCISDSDWSNSNEYFVKFNSNIKTLLHEKILVGSLNQLNQITNVILSFHDINDNILQDNNGQLLQYSSIPQDFGHFFEFSLDKVDYTYARFIFKVLSNANFDPNTIFFHFPHSLLSLMMKLASGSMSRWSNFSSIAINGSRDIYIDFAKQIFNVSIPCPSNWHCIWMLDNTSIVMTPNTSIELIFRPDQIGHHILSYVAIINDKYIYLVSKRLSIKPQIDTAVLLDLNDSTIYGLWNTSAGGDDFFSSTGNASGNYNPEEIPEYVLDNNSSTKYNSYGPCGRYSQGDINTCGINTGFYLILRSPPSLLLAFRFRAANNLPERDPLNVTIEGSNQKSSELLSGSDWTLIYNGSTGLDDDPGRYNFGIQQSILDNTLWFTSYRVLITAKRNSSNAVQYADVQFYGYYY